MISWGPRQSPVTFKKSTQNMLNISTSVVESGEVSHDTSPNIGMSIKDPLVTAGLTMEENYWKLMTTSYVKQVAKIKTKFGVDFKESGISQGKVEVKVCYQRSGGNASMESHALRALLHLYQKIATSPLSLSHLAGATGFRGSPENLSKAGPSEGASGGPVWNETSGNNTEAPTGGGATAGDNQDDNCSICLDTFTNKKQLKCKHEFCEACLEQSKASMGPTCPLCKDVFGMMEGDQPYGKMTTEKKTFHLDGFPGCGTIIINYDIPSGKQTAKHPHPGKYLTACHRTAYLPDNKEGREVLHLLEKAFKQKLIFTVGTSRTSGMDDVVTWNDIHHKTSTSGGPQSFGYPDPHYLGRVREELKAKGIEKKQKKQRLTCRARSREKTVKMSNNEPEDMDVEYSDGSYIQQTSLSTTTDTSTKALMASSQDKDGVQAILSFKWSEDVPLQKCQHKLQKVFQSWNNNNNNLWADCKVLKVLEDGKVKIRLTPAPGKPIPASELQKLSGQSLQGKDGNTVTILSVTLTPLQLETQKPSTNLPPSQDVVCTV
ncbi:hypothetical protein F7725_017197 [Dissostichus mawsoni]|uniref:E3 ubiquitin-protein ligase n=1 Tax=Dissostichus mawsoni TaxID=36200 RepID=A0A7J5Z3X3_DISMA|nr:hypothetical protein F7725_017197 [Dissostichus mawsoni]